jgi:nicotinate-nucleotide adenylyltransferase
MIDPKVYSAPFFLEQHRLDRLRRKIGLYCGTFNPPHLGHLKVARAALCHVDELWVIPSRQSPHKTDAPIDGEHRARMLELLLGDVPRVRIDRREIEKSEPSYTGQTIREIQGEHPRAAISLIIGDDQLPDLGRWWEFEAWKDQVSFLIAPRRGHRISREDLQTVDLAIPADAINATEIRQLAASGKPFDHWTGESVAEYAVKHALYSSTSPKDLSGS